MNPNSIKTITNPHNLSSKIVVDLLDSSIDLGLTNHKIKTRIDQFGKNELPHKKPKKLWEIILDQFLNPIIYILVAAALLAFIFKDWTGIENVYL